MQAETALGRVGLWFLVMLVAMAAALDDRLPADELCPNYTLTPMS